MTKPNFSSINMIIDQSGSMAHLSKDTIGSFNNFLAEQKLVPGEAALTVTTFNYTPHTLHDFVNLTEVPDLTPETYQPSGGTALLDAIGLTMDTLGQKLAAMAEPDRPSKVLFVIITDGEENSSRKYTLSKIKDMIEHQRQVYSWEFIFLGANIDAVSVGSSLGVAANNSFNYSSDSIGIRNVYKGISATTQSFRSGSGSSTFTSNFTATTTSSKTNSQQKNTVLARDSRGRFVKVTN